MASLQASSLVLPSRLRSVQAAISVPKLPKIRLPIHKSQSTSKLVEELTSKNGRITHNNQQQQRQQKNETFFTNPTSTNANATLKLYAILEAVADRIEIHHNVGVQRDNWNKLLLNSTNMIILSATTMAGISSTAGAAVGSAGLHQSSTLLFMAATGMLLIMNKIQPSQLAEEQRNATRLFKQLYNRIQTTIALQNPTETDVNDAMEKVLDLDKAFPLPLLGKMINKFPAKFEPAVWWSNKSERKSKKGSALDQNNNGWNQELESTMSEVAQVIKRRDVKDYMKLGNIALKINKILAVSGPLLTGIAAAGSAFAGNGNWGAVMAAAAGALACTVNTLEHGGQVGMVVEMYRNCAGIFTLMEETIQFTLEERDLERRENGEMFEMNLSLELGRSLSELRDLARKSSSSRLEGIDVDEFASKLF